MLRTVFDRLAEQRVVLEGIMLKPNSEYAESMEHALVS